MKVLIGTPAYGGLVNTTYALRGGYDRLVFIDADITWTYTDKARLSAKRRLDVLRNLRRQRHPHPP